VEVLPKEMAANFEPAKFETWKAQITRLLCGISYNLQSTNL